METDEDSQLLKLTAKVLMLETIQTSMCTFLADHRMLPNGFVEKVFDDAENELRVMAIAGNSTTPAFRRSVDLALVYLAENSRTIRSALNKERSPEPKQPHYGRE